MPVVECDLPLFAPHAFPPVNDELFREQWNLELIRGPAAWSRPAPSPLSNVVVAVIDSGINRNHPGLNNAHILPGQNFSVSVCGYCGACAACVGCIICADINICEYCGECHVCGPNNTRLANDTRDENGHGTAVTGIIAARRGSREGKASRLTNDFADRIIFSWQPPKGAVFTCLSSQAHP